MPRYFNGPSRPKGLPKGYDSWTELRLHLGEFQRYDHHTVKLQYTVEHTYTPDFVTTNDAGVVFYVEVKGRFRDSAEAAKYVWVRKALPENSHLLFVFEDAGKAMPHAKARKDGTKRTHGDWATKHGFTWRCMKRGDFPVSPTLKEAKEYAAEQ